MSEKLKDEILKLANSVFDDIKRVMDLNALETLRINVLGKKGKITNYLKELKNLDYDSRIEIGTILNNLKIAYNILAVAIIIPLPKSPLIFLINSSFLSIF